MNREQIINAIISVAEDFDLIPQNTILNVNLEKHYHELKTMINLTSNKKNIKIRDIGGGMGVNLLTLSKLNYGEELILIDRFDEYLIGTSMGTFNDKIIERFKKNNILFYNQDILSNTRLNFSSNYFDIVTIIDVIEHLPKNPIELLKEIHRVLKPNGYIYLASPNLFGLSEITNFLSGKHIYIKFNEWIKTTYYSHFREYSFNEHKKLLELAGFIKVQARFHENSFWLRFRKENGFKAWKYLFGFVITRIFPFVKSTVVVIGRK